MRKLFFITFLFSLVLVLTSCVDLIVRLDDNTQSQVAGLGYSNENTQEPYLNEHTIENAPQNEPSPAELTVLFAGTFITGEDIPPGRYDVFPTYSDFGILVVQTPSGRTVVRELMSTDGINSGVDRVRVHLQDGYSIQIHNISSMTFEPQ
jgi:hypothetical protein